VGPGHAQGFTEVIRHKMDTGDAVAVKQNYFRRSQKEHVDAELDKMLESGVIHPSKSPWGAPVVPVRKKVGKLCILATPKQRYQEGRIPAPTDR
jgi:hypothetical protein